jgi:hypothetical protein
MSALPWARPAPVRLAQGERIVWQAGPAVRPLALRLYHLRLIALYGGGLTLADMIQARLHDLGHWGALQAAIPGVLTTAAALVIFCMLALGSARTTRYTLTDRRLIMQCGLALPATLSMPLDRIAAVAVRVHRDGAGDITVQPHPGAHLVYAKLWPFARPWRFANPEPMLREVPAAGYVATILSRMVAVATAAPVDAPVVRQPLAA